MPVAFTGNTETRKGILRFVDPSPEHRIEVENFLQKSFRLDRRCPSDPANVFGEIKQNYEDPGGNGRHRTSNQQQKREHPMPSPNTRLFTNIDMLGTVRPESLVARDVIFTAMLRAVIESPHLANNRRGLNTPCRATAASERGSK